MSAFDLVSRIVRRKGMGKHDVNPIGTAREPANRISRTRVDFDGGVAETVTAKAQKGQDRDRDADAQHSAQYSPAILHPYVKWPLEMQRPATARSITNGFLGKSHRVRWRQHVGKELESIISPGRALASQMHPAK